MDCPKIVSRLPVSQARLLESVERRGCEFTVRFTDGREFTFTTLDLMEATYPTARL